MINFITTKDIPFTINSEARISIDEQNLYNRVARFGLRRDYIIAKLKPLVKDMEFPPSYELHEVRDIILDFTNRVNEVVGPIIRYEALRNERVPNYIDLGKLISKNDIEILRFFDDSNKDTPRSERPVKFTVNIRNVFNKLEKTKVHFSNDERKDIEDMCREYIDKHDINTKDKIYDTYSEFSDERNEIREELFKKINDRLMANVEDIIINHLLDDACATLYFGYDIDERKVLYDETRISYLMTAMGIIDSPTDNAEALEYIKRLSAEVNKDIAAHLATPRVDFETLTNIPLLVNSDMINSILYVANNEIPLKIAHTHRAPAILIDMANIDVLYVVRCSHMMDFDKVLEDVSSRYGVDKASLYDNVTPILDEVQDVFRLFAKDKVGDTAPCDVIYKACLDAYTKMCDVAAEKSTPSDRGIYTLGGKIRQGFSFSLETATAKEMPDDPDSRARNKLL